MALLFSRQRKIKLIGWYGYGAVGDDLIEGCIRNLLLKAARKKKLRLQFTQDERCHLLVVGGGSIVGVDTLNLYSKLRDKKVPIVFFGSGFRREKRNINPENIRRMKILMNKAFLVGVRGYVSQQMLIQNGIDNAEVIGDPALSFEPCQTERLFGDFKIGMVVRNVPFKEPQYLDNNASHKIFGELADSMIEKIPETTLYFFPFTENEKESDSAATKEVLKIMRHSPTAHIIPATSDYKKLGSLIGQMDYMISQRLHPSILAWTQGIPCIAFEYQFNKTVDIMNSIGLDEFVIRTDEFTLNLYNKKLDRLLSEKKVILSQVRKSINYWKNKQEKFAERCLDVIN